MGSTGMIGKRLAICDKEYEQIEPCALKRLKLEGAVVNKELYEDLNDFPELD
jgi:hypothetical protein